MKQDDDCQIGYAIVDLHCRLGHGQAFESLKREYLTDPDMGCDDALMRAADLATVEQAEQVELALPTYTPPAPASIQAEARMYRGQDG